MREPTPRPKDSRHFPKSAAVACESSVGMRYTALTSFYRRELPISQCFASRSPRVLSSYYFILRRPLYRLHRKLKRERLGIDEYLRLVPHRSNFQCRFVAGVENGAS